MRYVEGRKFEERNYATRSVITQAKGEASDWLKEGARQEVFKALADHYGDDLPRAMTHIVFWREVLEDFNVSPLPSDPPGYKPDVRLRLSVIVEGFDG